MYVCEADMTSMMYLNTCKYLTSISNLRLSLRSGSAWSSARRFISPMVQGQGGLNTYTTISQEKKGM